MKTPQITLFFAIPNSEKMAKSAPRMFDGFKKGVARFYAGRMDAPKSI